MSFRGSISVVKSGAPKETGTRAASPEETLAYCDGTQR